LPFIELLKSKKGGNVIKLAVDFIKSNVVFIKLAVDFIKSNVVFIKLAVDFIKVMLCL
jgi:hypothetical protein